MGLHIWSGVVYTAVEFLKANTWYHVAATYPAKGNVGSIKLYLNGVLVKKGYAIDHKGAIPKTATNVAWIGNRPADQSGSYQGTISSAYMWSRELSAAEISQLYKAGRLGTMRAGVKVPPPPSLRDKSHKIWSGCVLRHEYAITGNSGDMCGGDNGGSLKGGAKIVKGDGLRLSGAKADKVVIAKPSTFPSGSSARTSAAWVKTKSDSARQFIISYGTTSGASHKHWDFELNGWTAKHKKDFGVHIWSGVVYTAVEFLKANTWYHVAATYPAKGNVGSIKLYLNGVLVKKGYAIDHKGAIPKTATNVAWIGNRPADQSGAYQGTISSAYMWSRELSATEISQLYHAGRLGTMRVRRQLVDVTDEQESPSLQTLLDEIKELKAKNADLERRLETKYADLERRLDAIELANANKM